METVQAHGPKKRLLLAALEAASAGAEGGRSILELPEAQAVLAQEDAREGLLGLAAFAAELNGRIGRLWQAMAAAAQGDPEICGGSRRVAGAHPGGLPEGRRDCCSSAEACGRMFRWRRLR